MDKVEDEFKVKLFKRDQERIYISARDDRDLERLKDKIVSIIKANYQLVSMHIPFTDGDILDYMMTNYDIISTEYDENGTNIKFEISKEDMEKYGKYIQSL